MDRFFCVFPLFFSDDGSGSNERGFVASFAAFNRASRARFLSLESLATLQQKIYTNVSSVNRVPIGLRGKRTDLALRSCTSLSCAFDDFLAISNETASGASGSDSEVCDIFIWGYNRGKGTSYGLLKEKKWGRV